MDPLLKSLKDSKILKQVKTRQSFLKYDLNVQCQLLACLASKDYKLTWAMQCNRRLTIAPHVFAHVRSMKLQFKKLDRHRNTLSRNTQLLRVVIAHWLFLAYCTNFVIF